MKYIFKTRSTASNSRGRFFLRMALIVFNLLITRSLTNSIRPLTLKSSRLMKDAKILCPFFVTMFLKSQHKKTTATTRRLSISVALNLEAVYCPENKSLPVLVSTCVSR